jgi:hypothetical protein
MRSCGLLANGASDGKTSQYVFELFLLALLSGERLTIKLRDTLCIIRSREVTATCIQYTPALFSTYEGRTVLLQMIRRLFNRHS